VILVSYPLPSTDPLGTDLLLDHNGDLVTTTSGSLDFATQQDNVAQAVRMNLTTIPFTYLWGNDVGTVLAQYVDEPITDSIEKEIENIIVEKLIGDSRILQVQGVEIDSSQRDTLILTVDAVVASLGVVQIPILIGG
jgi:hypothetical protein